MKLENQNFVIQQLVKCHQVTLQGRLGTWRTVSKLAAENEALRLLRSQKRGVFRALSSPSKSELCLNAEVTEWTI
jgi:hypothetical protein